MIKPLVFNHRSSWAIAANCLLVTGFTLGEPMGIGSMAIAESIAQANFPTNNCAQLTNRRYITLIDRPASALPQLPRYLALAAVPCNYLNGSMTFFGGFDNVKTSAFRANQLRELGLDAVVYSFNARVNDIPPNLQAAAVLVEALNNDPNAIAQQVQSLTGKGAVAATIGNRSVVVTAPLSSQRNANAIASLLRSKKFAAQVINANIITPASSVPVPTPNPETPAPPTINTSIPNPDSTSKRTIYRVLVPNVNANTLKQMKAIAPDAFVTIFGGKPYVQVQTYYNRDNAQRERNRLNAIYPGTLLLRD